jgi:hypothetical protein
LSVIHAHQYSLQKHFFDIFCRSFGKKAQKQRSHIKAPLVFRFLSLYNGYIRGSAVRQAAAGMAPAAMKKTKEGRGFHEFIHFGS